MLDSLLWYKALDSTDAREQLRELQTGTLRLFLTLAGISYVVWHYSTSLLWPTLQRMNQAYDILPAAVLVIAGTLFLLPRSEEIAKLFFVCTALLAVTWALLVLRSQQVLMLYSLVALVTAFVIHPLGGLILIGILAGLLMLIGATHPGLVASADAWFVIVFSAAAVAGVWAVMQHLFLALNWYARSYTSAERRRHDAEEHRANLVEAWGQLDRAYYRLERAHEAVRVAWRAADEAERSKMELAASISHELRTPLNLVTGYSELMMISPDSYGGTMLPPVYRRDMYAVYCAGQHLLELTDDVLDLARLEAGRLGLYREAVDLAQVIREAAALVSDYIKSKGLEVRLDLPPDLPILSLDRLRIREVLLNLLTNAARHTEQGCISVQVLPQEHAVRVSVSDTGPGIAPEDLSRIFQRFTSLAKPKSERHKGAGLGLPLSKRFIELHGGEMGAESTLGGGSVFWFTLPVDNVDTGDAFVDLPDMARPARPYARDRHPVLVLAQADTGLERLLRRHLQDCRIESADGISAAEARAQECKAAAILADFSEAPGQVKGGTPLIRCQLPSFLRTARELGVAGYLAKPITREALLSAMGVPHNCEIRQPAFRGDCGQWPE